MVFNNRKKYDEEIEKHKDHETREWDDDDQGLVGIKCRTCNKIIQWSKFADESYMNKK